MTQMFLMGRDCFLCYNSGIKIFQKLTILIVLFLVFFLVNNYILKNRLATTQPTPTPTPTTSVLGVTASQINSKCHISGELPDPACTPGVTDPHVTQENIYQTICVRGYTATVRPPVSYTNQLKIIQINEYGFSDKNLSDYEEDHLISLELGGSPTDPKNLWPEPGHSPNPKDKIENLCHQKVCSGQITLEKAQKQIATNWPAACQ